MQRKQAKFCCSCGSELEEFSVFCHSCGERNVIKDTPKYPQAVDSRTLEIDEEKTDQILDEECLEDDFNAPVRVYQIDNQQNSDIDLSAVEEVVPWYDSSFWDVPVPSGMGAFRYGCITMIFSLLSGSGYGECVWVRGRWGLIFFWIPGAFFVLTVLFSFLYFYFFI